MNEKKKPRKSPDLDRRLIDKIQTFTIAPDNAIQYWASSNRWGKCFDRVYKDMIEMMDTGCIHNINIYPDLGVPPSISPSELIPRIHWHGLIEFNDVPEAFSRSFMHLNHYRIEIDTIDDPDYWESYMKKFIKMYPQYERYSIKLCLDTDKVDTLKRGGH